VKNKNSKANYEPNQTQIRKKKKQRTQKNTTRKRNHTKPSTNKKKRYKSGSKRDIARQGDARQDKTRKDKASRLLWRQGYSIFTTHKDSFDFTFFTFYWGIYLLLLSIILSPPIFIGRL
jgi:hypothetical protein